MPTYPYACTACGHAFEVQQSFTDPSLTECPECSGRLRKVFSSVGVVFKGTGFYRNDSRKGASGSDAGTGAGTSADKAAGSNGAASSPQSGGTAGKGSTGAKGSESSAGSAGSGSGTSGSTAKPAASSAPAAGS